MRRLNFRNLFITLLLLTAVALTADEAGIFSILKSNVAPGKQAAGYYLLPTSQLLRPWGEQTLIAGRPVDMTFDSMKRILAVRNTRAIWLLDGSTGALLKQ